MNTSDVIAFIHARGGSKRIPRKNIRLFCGKPMVAWPIVHACASGLFKEVIISTDDQAIADTAVQAGASFYGFRPAELSDDHAGTAEVLYYDLQCYIERTGTLPMSCCCLYGTSALALPSLLQQGYSALQNSTAELLMAVLPYAHPIERALHFDAAGLLQYCQPEFVLKRTQDIEPSYHDSGMFYWFIPDAFFRHGGKSFAPLRKKGLVVSPRAAVDIDTEEDWELAEIIAHKIGLGIYEE
jgi:N-acylneuraminate cytidylyltransferase